MILRSHVRIVLAGACFAGGVTLSCEREGGFAAPPDSDEP